MLMPIIAGGQADGGIIATADPLAWRRAPLFIARAESKTADSRAATGSQPDRSANARSGLDQSALMPQSRDLFVRLVSEVGWQ